MASAVWPPALPQSPRVAELIETPPSLVVRTEMDVGPAKVRRRTVANPTLWQMTMVITRNLRSTFLDFYNDTIQGGAVAFDWRNPVTLAPAEFRLVGQPTLRPLAARGNGNEPYLLAFVVEEFLSISNAVIVPPGQPELPPWLLTRDDPVLFFEPDPLNDTHASAFAEASGPTNPFEQPQPKGTSDTDIDTRPPGGGFPKPPAEA